MVGSPTIVYRRKVTPDQLNRPGRLYSTISLIQQGKENELNFAETKGKRWGGLMGSPGGCLGRGGPV